VKARQEGYLGGIVPEELQALQTEGLDSAEKGSAVITNSPAKIDYVGDPPEDQPMSRAVRFRLELAFFTVRARVLRKRLAGRQGFEPR
jgi:hypothetical protein